MNNKKSFCLFIVSFILLNAAPAQSMILEMMKKHNEMARKARSAPSSTVDTKVEVKKVESKTVETKVIDKKPIKQSTQDEEFKNAQSIIDKMFTHLENNQASKTTTLRLINRTFNKSYTLKDLRNGSKYIYPKEEIIEITVMRNRFFLNYEGDFIKVPESVLDDAEAISVFEMPEDLIKQIAEWRLSDPEDEELQFQFDDL